MEMMEDNLLFLDTNILAYATFDTSPFHSRALTALEEKYRLGWTIWISRQILRELLAVLTRPDQFGRHISKERALQQVKFFAEKFKVADEDQQVTAALHSLAETYDFGGKQVHDANIVATMQVHQVKRILTHNVSDFQRFNQIIEIIPLVENE